MTILLNPWKLDSLLLRNRIWMAPVKTAFGTPEGRVTDRHLHFYRRVARGGAGLLLIEPVPVRWEGREHPKQLAVTLADSSLELAKIVKVIHGGGAKAGLNLNHAGRAANPKASGMDPLAPSACACPAKGTRARGLSPEEIEDIIAAFGRAAAVAEAAGFDCVEIQAGHGYLLQQFLDPEVNHRADDYGRDLLLFARRVLETVRSACHLPLSLRVTLRNQADVLERERLGALLGLAAASGFVSVHVGMGDACTNPPWYYHHGALPEAPQEEILRIIRDLTQLPLVAAGRMGDLDRATRILDEGLADAIALGRPLVADPGLPAKWQAGAFDAVVACGSCLQGCLAKVARGEGLSCIVNPSVGKPPIAPSKIRRRVLVAGAGPAGLSAALALWDRGHGVIVAEAGDEPGGTFRAAPLSPGKESMARPLRGLLKAVERAGIPVLTNQAVNEEYLRKIRPEVLIWAVGAEAIHPPIEGLDTVPSLTSKEYYLEGRELPGRRIMILGGGLVGVEAAEKLALEGREVVVVEKLPQLGGTMEGVGKALLFKRLAALPNVTLLPSTTVRRIGEDALELETPDGAKSLPPVDAVLLAAGLRPEPAPEVFRDLVQEVHVVGDAKRPRDVESAVQEGYEAGIAV
jgi:2,4-dienoyl-CoA reductase-like NADH-dependent reductase (Old Yellow Enzyme family)/NADPH-dependent 2,4-dienoyl-CoA reductase/sulfur reductase-like enzyme